MRAWYEALRSSIKHVKRETDEEYESKDDRETSTKICQQLRILCETNLADITNPLQDKNNEWHRELEETVTLALKGEKGEERPRKVWIRSSSIFPERAERIDVQVEGSERFLRLGKTGGTSLDNTHWQPRRVLLKEALFFNAMATAAVFQAQGRKHSG